MSEEEKGGRGWFWRAISVPQAARDGWLFVLTVASISGGATYGLTRMWGSYELEDYRQGKQLKLSETIGELKDLSVALAPSVADQRKLAALEPLPSENEELKLKLKTAQDRIASLNATLANVSQPVQTKELAKGASFEPIPNGIMIAVKDIHGYASKCQVSLGGKIEDIVAGSRKGGFDPRSGTDFTIGVVSVSENVCVLKYQRESPAATEEVATGGADD